MLSNLLVGCVSWCIAGFAVGLLVGCLVVVA